MATATLRHLPATVLSILGSIVAIGVIVLGLLAVPFAALVVFGPALLDLL